MGQDKGHDKVRRVNFWTLYTLNGMTAVWRNNIHIIYTKF